MPGQNTHTIYWPTDDVSICVICGPVEAYIDGSWRCPNRLKDKNKGTPSCFQQGYNRPVREWEHAILEMSSETHGTCNVCGSVRVYGVGTSRLRCSNKINSHPSNRRSHGLTTSEAQEYTSEAGKCAICGESEKRLVVDHCHNTNVIRGALCVNCNSGLGMFQDDPELLLAAIEYLGDDPWQLLERKRKGLGLSVNSGT